MSDDVLLRSHDVLLQTLDAQIASAEQMLREWISMSDYARKYGITRHTVYKWMDADLVRYYRVGRLVRVHDSVPHQSSRCA